jgi:hypothetical protein
MHREAALTALIPKLSCRGCRPNAPFAELLKLSQTSIGDELFTDIRERCLAIRSLPKRPFRH